MPDNVGNEALVTSDGRSWFIILLIMWLSFLGGAVAWTVFHPLSYLWVTVACDVSWRIVMNATTLVSGLAAIALSWMSYRGWRRSEADSESRSEMHGDGWLAFFTLAGLGLNLIFTITIIMSGVAAWFLNPCG